MTYGVLGGSVALDSVVGTGAGTGIGNGGDNELMCCAERMMLSSKGIMVVLNRSFWASKWKKNLSPSVSMENFTMVSKSFHSVVRPYSAYSF